MVRISFLGELPKVKVVKRDLVEVFSLPFKKLIQQPQVSKW